MKKLIVKKWIDGKFQEVKQYFVDNVQQIRHHKDGIEIISNGSIQLYDSQCVVEFKN